MSIHTIRNTLQLTARKLLTQTYQCDKQCRTAMTALVATIQSYLEIRKSLVPYIAPDGYMQELTGALYKLQKAIKQLAMPVFTTPEAGFDLFAVTVAIEQMDALGTGVHLCDSTVLVEAKTPEAASLAVVNYFVSGDAPIVHFDDIELHSQSRVTYLEHAGHTAWLQSRGIRYTSVCVCPVTPELADGFKMVTHGLTSTVCVKA